MDFNSRRRVGQQVATFMGSWPYLVGVTIGCVVALLILLGVLPSYWLLGGFGAFMGLPGCAAVTRLLQRVGHKPATAGVRLTPPLTRRFHFLNIKQINDDLSQIEGGELKEFTRRSTRTDSVGVSGGIGATSMSGSRATGMERGETVRRTTEAAFNDLRNYLSEHGMLKVVNLNETHERVSAPVRDDYIELRLASATVCRNGQLITTATTTDVSWGKLMVDVDGGVLTDNKVGPTGSVAVMGKVSDSQNVQAGAEVTLKVFAIYS